MNIEIYQHKVTQVTVTSAGLGYEEPLILGFKSPVIKTNIQLWVEDFNSDWFTVRYNSGMVYAPYVPLVIVNNGGQLYQI